MRARKPGTHTIITSAARLRFMPAAALPPLGLEYRYQQATPLVSGDSETRPSRLIYAPYTLLKIGQSTATAASAMAVERMAPMRAPLLRDDVCLRRASCPQPHRHAPDGAAHFPRGADGRFGAPIYALLIEEMPEEAVRTPGMPTGSFDISRAVGVSSAISFQGEAAATGFTFILSRPSASSIRVVTR